MDSLINLTIKIIISVTGFAKRIKNSTNLLKYGIVLSTYKLLSFISELFLAVLQLKSLQHRWVKLYLQYRR